MFNFHSLKQPMVLILDCYSEHVLHAGRKVGLFGEKNRFVPFLDLINASNRGNKRDFSLRAHLFHLLPSNIGPWTSLVVLCKISKFTLCTPVHANRRSFFAAKCSTKNYFGSLHFRPSVRLF